MKKYHEVSQINFTNDNVELKIDGKLYQFSLTSISKKLVNASEVERINFKISPSGYGIHWPLIDEDISIDGLLKIAERVPNQSIATM